MELEAAAASKLQHKREQIVLLSGCSRVPKRGGAKTTPSCVLRRLPRSRERRRERESEEEREEEPASQQHTRCPSELRVWWADLFWGPQLAGRSRCSVLVSLLAWSPSLALTLPGTMRPGSSCGCCCCCCSGLWRDLVSWPWP